jgi:hypothetical protein
MAILRKLKNKISKKAAKQKKAAAPAAPQNDFPGATQTIVEQAKYHTPQPVHQPPRGSREELPGGYGIDKIVLQVRDPWWCHAYWEVTAQTWDKLKEQLKEEFHRARRVLRVYDISHILFDGTNAHRFFDIDIQEQANNWYIDTGGPGRSWCVDMGLLLPGGKFITIVRSNTVHTPLDGPSWITDEEWMIPDDMFARLYGLGVGFGSSPVRAKKPWEERLKREIGSGGLSSMASPVRKPLERGFWLVVNTELIVYGATEPSAKVTVQGRAINLRPDGTFSLRFALPDGKQVIPVEATSADQEDKRVITPIVTRETK